MTSVTGWRRRWRIWAAAASATVALYASFGFFIVPRIARAQIVKQARALLHRQASVARVRFNPFTLTAVVEGLDLRDRDGAELFHLDRLTADFQASGVFKRAFRFREIVFEGPRAVARITADGRFSIADLFEAKETAAPAEAAAALPRVLIDRLALHGGAAELVDESRSPRFVEKLAPLDLELHGLTTIPDESGDHSVTIGLHEGARVRWSGRQTVEPVHFEGTVEIEGIRLPRVWNYLGRGNPLTIREGKADLRCSYDIRRGEDRAFAVAVKGLGVEVHDVAIQPRTGGDDWLNVPLLTVTGAEALWPESRVEVREVRVDGARAVSWLDPDGTVNWRSAVPAANAATTSATTPAAAATPWTLKIGSVELANASAHFEDRTIEPNVVVDLTDVAVKLGNVSSDLKAQVQASLKARINGGGLAEASGTVVPEPLTADLDVKLGALDLRPFVPYALRLPGVDLRSAVLGAAGQLHLGAGSPRLQFDGGAELTALHVAGAGTDRLVACDRATVSGARVTVLPEKIRLAKVRLAGAFMKLEIDREGHVNLKKLTTPDAAAASAPAASAARARKPLDLDIGSIAVDNASADYTDESVILPFGTKIHSINGSIKDISTTSAVAAQLALEGRISESGYFKSDGTMRIAAPFTATDITVIFRGVHMPELTPYSAQFAGYSIEKGTLDVDVRYRIKDGRLVGDHRVIAKELTLGPKVEGAKGPGLPVRLAVALLKDESGRIDLEVPIEGTIDSPEFNYRSVFWQAFKTILGNVVKAPFRAIGRLFGADSEELELVGFASGHSELPLPEQEKLVKLGAELAGRSELTLEIEGRYDPVKDVEAIRHARLERRIDAKRAGTPKPEAILEALYTESFSADRLEAERQKFPDAADAGSFYDALRAQLLAGEDVSPGELAALAGARATAIQAALTAPGGLEASRVRVKEPAPVTRKKQGSELVASEMTLSAGD